MSTSNPTTSDSDSAAERARITLSGFVADQAAINSRRLGFGWIGVANAPSTYPQLRAAFAESAATKEPLPVSNLYCDQTVFLTPEHNVAFRFWHDVSHIRFGLSFSLADEWELALWHLGELAAAGYDETTPEHQLLRTDLLGQIMVMALVQRFPFDQADFGHGCRTLGLDAGVLAELRRRPS